MEEILYILRNQLKLKNEKNPNYSLRAFAKHLGVSPATLSRILSEQIEITPKIFSTIAPKLELSSEKENEIMRALQDDKHSKNIRRVDINGMSFIEKEKFNIIADWYHYAILHICGLEDFKQDPQWIADRLGIEDVDLIRDAIKRLIEHNFLGIDENNQYYKIDQFNAILDYDLSSKAMRERQKQILDISAKKIDEVPINLRDHSSITVNVDENLIPEIKERIKKFRRSLGNYIVKNNGHASQIYELQLSFFPLLKKKD